MSRSYGVRLPAVARCMPKEVPLVLTLTFSQPYYYYYSLTIPLTIAHITNQQQIITHRRPHGETRIGPDSQVNGYE